VPTRQSLTIALILAFTLVVHVAAFAQESSSTNYRLKANLLSNAGNASPNIVYSLSEPAAGRINGSNTALTSGFVPLSEKQILSVSLSQNTWIIPEIETNGTATMAEAEKIIITNDGNTKHVLEFKITDSAGWTSGEMPGRERFCLKAQIDGLNEILTAEPKRITSLRAKTSAELSMEFQSPTKTQYDKEQEIKITVTAQLPSGRR